MNYKLSALTLGSAVIAVSISGVGSLAGGAGGTGNAISLTLVDAIHIAEQESGGVAIRALEETDEDGPAIIDIALQMPGGKCQEMEINAISGIIMERSEVCDFDPSCEGREQGNRANENDNRED